MNKKLLIDINKINDSNFYLKYNNKIPIKSSGGKVIGFSELYYNTIFQLNFFKNKYYQLLIEDYFDLTLAGTSIGNNILNVLYFFVHIKFLKRENHIMQEPKTKLDLELMKCENIICDFQEIEKKLRGIICR